MLNETEQPADLIENIEKEQVNKYNRKSKKEEIQQEEANLSFKKATFLQHQAVVIPDTGSTYIYKAFVRGDEVRDKTELKHLYALNLPASILYFE